MSSILKVDTIQDTSGNNIINESSDTITIGASGDTISIPSGATIANSGTATGFGKVLQVVTATDSTQRTTTSTSYVTASNTLSVNITPSSTSSKIFVTVSSAFGLPSGADGIATIYRDSTNLEGSLGSGFARLSASNGASIVMNVLDSPNTTSQVTYQVYIRETSAVANLSLNWTGVTGTITAFEIGA
jgi:hypothetical protein